MRFTGRGQIPPVAPLQDTAAPPSASDRAFGEIAASQRVAAVGDEDTEEDASGKPGPKGSRFGGDGELGEVERGFKALEIGATGGAVRKVQQALFDLNYRPIEVTGTYDQMTADAVTAYQKAKGVGKKDGRVDDKTFSAIEKDFFDLTAYASAARHAPPGVHDTPKGTDASKVPVLLEETHALDADAKDEANAAISPAKAGGAVGPFQDKISAGTYEARVEKVLLAKIADEAKDAKAEKKHHDKGPLFSMNEMANVGNAAKAQVDAVFGSWAVGGDLKAGTTLNDRYEVDTAEQAKLHGTKGGDKKLHKEARRRAKYFLNTMGAFEDLDREHSADRTRATEAGIIDAVIDRVATAHEADLLLITATWSAATDDMGVIKIQRLKSGNDDQDRDTLWRKFGTLIHEYMHSLQHPAWRHYKDDKAKTDSQASHTLSEGVAELLTRTVISQINLNDKSLRKQVLGKISDDGEEPDLDRAAKYAAAFTRAQALVGVVGIHNLYAAYFLGQVDLIGA